MSLIEIKSLVEQKFENEGYKKYFYFIYFYYVIKENYNKSCKRIES
jgi:hypothetical protein